MYIRMVPAVDGALSAYQLPDPRGQFGLMALCSERKRTLFYTVLAV